MILAWFPLFLLIIVAGGLSVAMLILTLLSGRRLAAAFVTVVGMLLIVSIVAGWTTFRARHRANMYMMSAPNYTIKAWPHGEVHYEMHRGDVEMSHPGHLEHSWKPPVESAASTAPLARSTYAADTPAPPPVALPNTAPSPPAPPPATHPAGEPTGESSDAAATSTDEQASSETFTERRDDESAEPSQAQEATSQPQEELNADADEAQVDEERAESDESGDVEPQVAATDEPQSATASAGEDVAGVDVTVTNAAVSNSAEEAPEVAEVEASSLEPGADASSSAAAAEPIAATPEAAGPSPAPAADLSDPAITEQPHDAGPDRITDPTSSSPPAWVDQPPERIDGYWASVLVSDPFEVPYACDEDLQRRTRAAIAEFAQWRMRQLDLSPHARLPLRIGHEEVEMVVRERHYQRRATSMGEMYQGYQLTVMDDAFQKHLDRLIADALVADRLAATGAVSGVVLGGVALLFGVFRFAARKSPDPMAVG